MWYVLCRLYSSDDEPLTRVTTLAKYLLFQIGCLVAYRPSRNYRVALRYLRTLERPLFRLLYADRHCFVQSGVLQHVVVCHSFKVCGAGLWSYACGAATRDQGYKRAQLSVQAARILLFQVPTDSEAYVHPLSRAEPSCGIS